MSGGATHSISLVLLLCLVVLDRTCKCVDRWRQHDQHTGADYTDPNDHRHGGIKMGVSNRKCDDGVTGIDIDWDPQSTKEYTCELPAGQKLILGPYPPPPRETCTNKEMEPIHKCLNEPIFYEDPIPMSGAHRPLWPVYGEYRYLPPQRWLHSLEHGSAVFLYHPCADPAQIAHFKEIARSCIRRHVISPYKLVGRNRPFVIVTYKCRLAMSYIDDVAARKFIRKHSLRAPEWKAWEDGQYSAGLLKEADIISDLKDSVLCPGKQLGLQDDVQQEMKDLEKMFSSAYRR